MHCWVILQRFYVTPGRKNDLPDWVYTMFNSFNFRSNIGSDFLGKFICMLHKSVNFPKNLPIFLKPVNFSKNLSIFLFNRRMYLRTIQLL